MFSAKSFQISPLSLFIYSLGGCVVAPLVMTPLMENKIPLQGVWWSGRPLQSHSIAADWLALLLRYNPVKLLLSVRAMLWAPVCIALQLHEWSAYPDLVKTKKAGDLICDWMSFNLKMQRCEHIYTLDFWKDGAAKA